MIIPAAALLGALVLMDAAQAAADEKPFRFVVYGGTEGEAQGHPAIVKQIVKAAPEIVFHAGGAVGRGARMTQWRRFRQTIAPLLAIASFYGCPSKGEGAPLVAPKPGCPKPDLRGRSYYSFDHRGAHFVALDVNQPYDSNSPQTRWLASDLAAAAGKPIVVLTHYAVFGAAERYILREANLFWHPLFVRNRVAVVFSGARHLYHRTSQDGVAYIITGGGGALLNPVMARRQVLPGDVAGSYHHFIEMTLEAGRFHGRVVDEEGKTRDEFFIPLPAARNRQPPDKGQ